MLITTVIYDERRDKMKVYLPSQSEDHQNAMR
jgi:hypothetical protein